MSDQNTPVVTTESSGEGLLGAAAEATGKVARLALNVLSLPLLILPGQSRRHARKAVGEFTVGLLVLPREFASSAERVVDRLVGEAPSEGGGGLQFPRAEEITERARTFANRMIRTAEEFTAGVVSASQKVGDAAEQTAAKVDDWVQKKV